jgi:hypothetical protein
MTPPRCIRVVVANVQRRRRISSPIKKPLLCGGTWFRKLTGRRGGKSPRPQESPFERRRCQRPGQFAARKVASFLELELWAVGMQYGGAGIRDRGRQAGSQAGRQSADWRRGGALSARFKDGLVETSTVPNNSQKRNPELRDLHKLCVCIYSSI